MTEQEQLEAILGIELKDVGTKVYKLIDVNKAYEAITALIQEAVNESELGVAEWFEDGVPPGFTIETWLTVYRETPGITELLTKQGNSGGSNNE